MLVNRSVDDLESCRIPNGDAVNQPGFDGLVETPNREHAFERATLAYAFEEVTACAIMMAAQFGFHLDARWRSEMQSFFHFAAVPVWPFSDVYIHPYGVGDWTTVPLGF